MTETTPDAYVIYRTITQVSECLVFTKMSKAISQVKGAHSFVGNGTYQEYQVDFLRIRRLPDQRKDDMATLSIDACAQYSSIVTLQSNSEAECVWAIIEFMQSSANRCLQME